MSKTQEHASSAQSLLQLEEKLQLSRFKHQGVYLSSINGLGEPLVSIASGVENAIVCSPIDKAQLAEISALPKKAVNLGVQQSQVAFKTWRCVPAPQRGKLVAAIAQVVKENKEPLAELITLEVGKIKQEALGEVQEWIDICEFAVGLSRQLYGLTIATERVDHRMMEQWHPLGPVGVITAFNFPMAVWAWNAMLGLVCGDTLIWKPSEKAPLCALACQSMLIQAMEKVPEIPEQVKKGLSIVLLGQKPIGEALACHPQMPLISATGSIPMGRAVAQTVAGRLGRYLLELGGNNAIVLTPSANMELAIRGIVFSAVGTTGQRCTSLRRLIAHQSIAASCVAKIKQAYQHICVGDPRQESTLLGPLIDEEAFQKMERALDAAVGQGGEVLIRPSRYKEGVGKKGVYCTPGLVKVPARAEVVKQETFAPLLYLIEYENFNEALAIHNDVPQGLSSAIFTDKLQEAELFLSAAGSDCGIANVNIGTSGAEIGGAFGGEKETGGGRESGSDAWKNYMRRTTNTINYGDTLPLAQGITFGE